MRNKRYFWRKVATTAIGCMAAAPFVIGVYLILDGSIKEFFTGFIEGLLVGLFLGYFRGCISCKETNANSNNQEPQ